MKLLSLLLVFSLTACATTPPPPVAPKPELAKKVEKKPEAPAKAPQLEIQDVPEPLATVDSQTLKVTYKKGVDPRKVVDQVLRGYAATTNALAQCQAELAKKK